MEQAHKKDVFSVTLMTCLTLMLEKSRSLDFFPVVSVKAFNKGFTEAVICNFKRALKPTESKPAQTEFLLPAGQQ